MSDYDNVIQLADAGDCLHRGDIIGVRPDFYNRSFIQRQIISYQQKHGAPHPECELTHVCVVSSAKNWKAYSMQPPRGEEVDLKKYLNAQLWVLRYEDWRDDEQRYDFVERAAFIANSPYSVSGIMRLVTHVWPANPAAHFCSQQVQEASQYVGVRGGAGFSVDPAADCTPSDIALASDLRLVAVIWTGKG